MPDESHQTSLTAWDIQSPVVAGGTLTLKAGAKCAAGCGLTAHRIEMLDGTGARVGEAALGDSPWPGTSGLCWGEVEAPAPAAPGLYSWSLRLPGIETPVPHDTASCTFTFLTVAAPEHLVQVRIVEKETCAPIAHAHVRFGAYRAVTDETGVASFAVAGGTHRLCVSKAGYEAPELTVAVNRDEEVQLEAAVLPKEDPDAYWQG
jgi:hypothetical protein